MFAVLSLTRLRDACSPFLSNRGKTHRMNKIAHGIVLALFGVACWLVWALLQLPLMVKLPGVELHLPAFTRFCMAVGPFVVIGLATLATAYCVWVWCIGHPCAAIPERGQADADRTAMSWGWPLGSRHSHRRHSSSERRRRLHSGCSAISWRSP